MGRIYRPHKKNPADSMHLQSVESLDDVQPLILPQLNKQSLTPNLLSSLWSRKLNRSPHEHLNHLHNVYVSATPFPNKHNWGAVESYWCSEGVGVPAKLQWLCYSTQVTADAIYWTLVITLKDLWLPNLTWINLQLLVSFPAHWLDGTLVVGRTSLEVYSVGVC